MATEVNIPQLGESITEAVVASWLKADGAYVNQDEDIIELETDKVTMPLPAPVSGILRHSVAEGDTVTVGASVGTIDESAEAPAEGEARKAKPETKAEPAKAAAPAKPEPVAAGVSKEAEARAGYQSRPDREPSPPAGVGETASTPLARKIAEERGISLSAVRGTGPGGRIREQDVLAYLQSGASGNGATSAAAPAAPSTPDRPVRRERMSQLRQRIAVRLVEAQHTAAMLTTFNECDMQPVMDLRNRHRDAFADKHGVKLGFMSFFVKAVVSALREVPSVGAYVVQGEKGPEIEYHDYADIAVAVGTDKGLVVPVLRNAEKLGFADIEKGILDLAKKARDGKLTLEDMQGGTFTISNGGVYGSMLSTPILNAPQSGILGMHNIIRRPVENPAKPGSGEVVVRPMMYLALSYDHRIVDGQGAVTFLRHVKECIENPERLLLDV